MRSILPLLLTAATLFAATPKGADDRMSSNGRLAQQAINALHGTLGPAASPCFNMPDCDDEAATRLGNIQSETSIAVDATGQHIVIGFNDFRGFSAGPGISISGVIYSDDGGATFADGGRLPTGPTISIGGSLFPQIFGDPDVKYLGGCNFVYSSIMLLGIANGGIAQTLSVHRSSDCGHTWSSPVAVGPATNPNGRVDVNSDAEDAADKELADVDPDTSRYMLCWTNFTLSSISPSGIEISCTFSDNILGAAPVFSPRAVVAAALPDGQGSAVRFAGNGSPNAYVAWSRFPSTLNGYANNVGFARSTDNGVTWSAPTNLTNDFITMDYVLGNDRSNTNPSVAVDKSAGAFSGNLYVVYSNNNSLDGADVAFQRSTNGGVSFSSPVFLNARPGADRAQWFPYVTVDRNTGRVWVFYYDQGVAASGDRTQVSYQYSDDSGVTFSRPAALSPQTFKAGWGNDTGQPNLGDYNQAVAQSGIFYASYAATTQPSFTDGQPGTAFNTPDVFFSKLPAGTLQAALLAGTPTFTESGGNGNIDPGDTVNLKVPLQNYVTNGLNSSTIGGISAILSTTTPGVSITQAVSAYPSIAPGASAVNSTDFVLQMAPGFTPGRQIDLTLIVSSAAGTANLLLTLQTGTPVYTTLLNETFDGPSAGAGWTSVHGAGQNTIPWTLFNFAPSICGPTNKAFHQNANDGPAGGDNARWERFLSPLVNVPVNADYVTLDFDVCYDTEDDPVLRTLAYDGFFLRITDQTPGRTLRSLLAEAFEQEFTTDGFEHYPKHFPRNSDANYFEDMSAWAGFSNGTQHVHMRLPGMAGSRVQLRFEFAQDQLGTCADLRPGHACGVSLDNVVIRSVTSVIPASVDLQVTHSLARAPGTGEILDTVVVTNAGTATAANVQLTRALLGGIAPINALPNLDNIAPGSSATTVLRFPASAASPGSVTVISIAGTYVGGNFSASSRVAVP